MNLDGLEVSVARPGGFQPVYVFRNRVDRI